MAAAGLRVDPELVRYGDFGASVADRHATALLSLPRPPTAIFAGSDLQAFGATEAARRRGLRVPHDLSIVGFDDIAVAASSSPPLTTIRQPRNGGVRCACGAHTCRGPAIEAGADGTADSPRRARVGSAACRWVIAVSTAAQRIGCTCT